MNTKYSEIVELIARKTGIVSEGRSREELLGDLRALGDKLASKAAIYGDAAAYLFENKEDGEDSSLAESLQALLETADENGMLRGSKGSVAGDLANRFWLAMLLVKGYNGRAREAVETVLKKSMFPTLCMRSATGEAPFGGPYGEYRNTDLYLAALCDYYAGSLLLERNINGAEKFKKASEATLETILRELRREDCRGVKNFYDKDSLFGMEKHVTSAEILAVMGIAAVLCENTDCREPDPDEQTEGQKKAISGDGESATFGETTEGSIPGECFVWKTGCAFHKMFLNSGNYSAEYDLAADLSYDANGLGRLQRKDAPGALCLSLPFVTGPKYNVNGDNVFDAGICASVESEDGFAMSAEEGTRFELINSEADENHAEAEFRVCFRDGSLVRESLTLTKKEAIFKLTRERNPMKPEDENDVAMMLPAFLFDGKDYSEVALHNRDASITYRGWQLTYETNKSLIDTAITLTNRSGHYRMFMAAGAKNVQVRIRMEKVGEPAAQEK